MTKKRGPVPRVTESKVLEAVFLYESGKSLRKIAGIVAMSPTSVGRMLKGRVEMRDKQERVKHDWSPRDLELKRAYEGGASMIQLARKHNISRQRVYQIIRAVSGD